MNWETDDVTLEWLKVKNPETERVYFVPWNADPALTTAGILPVIPAAAEEGTGLKVTLEAGEVPAWEGARTLCPAIRDRELADLWHRERQKLEETGAFDEARQGGP